MNSIELIIENNIVCGKPKIVIGSKQNASTQTFDCTEGTQTIVTDLELSAYDTLEIRLIDREHNHNSDSQTTVEILDLYVDDINLQHLIFDGVMYPQYDINFVETFSPPVNFCPGTVFYNNGVYELSLRLPIYKFIVNRYEEKIS